MLFALQKHKVGERKRETSEHFVHRPTNKRLESNQSKQQYVCRINVDMILIVITTRNRINIYHTYYVILLG